MAVNEINGCFHCNMLFSEPPRKNTAWFTGWVVLDELKDHVHTLKYLFGSKILYVFVAEGNPYILHLRSCILWPRMDVGVKLKVCMCCISVCIPQLTSFSFALLHLKGLENSVTHSNAKSLTALTRKNGSSVCFGFVYGPALLLRTHGIKVLTHGIFFLTEENVDH